MENLENIRVAARLRPLNRKEKEHDSGLYEYPITITSDTKENSVTIEKKSQDRGHSEVHSFFFDHVFDEKTTQEEVFEILAKKSVVEWVIEGYNSTIFAYGPTSSGKTYTMFGVDSDGDGYFNTNERGIIPRVCELLFNRLETKEENIETSVKCSFLEIYKENIRDLLKKNSVDRKDDENLKIRTHPHGTYIQGLSQKFVSNTHEVLSVIEHGAKQRSMASTSLNSVSSRSHAVLTLVISQKLNDGTEIVSKLNLVDLAGSENVGRSEVMGTNLQEAQQINKSLSSLGGVINALTERGREHIPYRDSKLTYLLQDSLGGNSRTILIITISPHISCYFETMSTLKFGKRAKDIKNTPVLNRKDVDTTQRTGELLKIIEELQKKYDDAISVIEKNSPAEENKLVTSLRLSISRLEKKIGYYERDISERKKLEIENANFFEKQRELSIKLSLELHQEQIRVATLRNEVEKYNVFCKIIKDVKNVSALEKLLEIYKKFGL